jgi:hypothetical protein
LTRRSSADTRPRSSGYENGVPLSSDRLSGLFGPIPVEPPAEPKRKPRTALDFTNPEARAAGLTP